VPRRRAARRQAVRPRRALAAARPSAPSRSAARGDPGSVTDRRQDEDAACLSAQAVEKLGPVRLGDDVYLLPSLAVMLPGLLAQPARDRDPPTDVQATESGLGLRAERGRIEGVRAVACETRNGGCPGLTPGDGPDVPPLLRQPPAPRRLSPPVSPSVCGSCKTTTSPSPITSRKARPVSLITRS
jgi:hypothetical protein